MNKKIAFSMMSILTSLALMGGATFAFFSSTATSTGNVFATGSLTLLLDDNNESTPAATVTSSLGGTLVPGSSTTGSISLHNGGSIKIAEVNIDSAQTVTSNPDLAEKLNITAAKIGDDDTCVTNTVDVKSTFPATLALLDSDTDGIDLPGTDLNPSQKKYLCLTLTLDSATDNTYQGKTITETFTFVGHQDLSQ
jgi:predicted ribosomally synthesized peptide with SipW-like signal peptide